VGKLGWGVIVEQPEAVAYRAAAEMRQRILVLILSTVALVLVTGLIFASRLRRVLAIMMAGARAFGEGRLGRRIRVKSSDEIGELATTMNTMAERLERSARELEQWSLMLESRVEERTRELKQTHAQLLTQSKLAAIGQLGAGVAHEVNNPLAGVLGLVQLMMRNRSEDDPDLRKLKDIETGAKRCKDIVMRLLRFSERRMAGRMRVSLNDVLDEVLDMMQDSLQKSDIEIERQWDVNLPKPTADPGQLAQVFINILHNARSAMPKGGALRVTTAAAGADHVMAIVTDTGEGIEPDHLPRVFDPFFTTKRVWTDVGLGLSVAHRIVSDHGGRIDVDSELGRGSTFKVVLPLEPPARVDEDLPPRKTILLD
jgi:signal transduction histidine kinase